MTEVETRPPRPKKVAVVEDVKNRFESSSAVILTEYRGMTVEQLQTLRRTLRAAGAEYRVVKCTLARLAAADAGLDDLVPLLEGPLAFTFVEDDAAAAAKALVDVAKGVDALVIKGGVLDGALIEASDTNALAKLPPREILLSQIAGAFKAPIQQTANLLAAPLQSLANLLDAYSSKRVEQGEEPVAEEPVAEEPAAEAAEPEESESDASESEESEKEGE